MSGRKAALLLTISLLGGCASIDKPDARPEISMPGSFTFAPTADGIVTPRLDSLLPADDAAFHALLKRAYDAPDLAIALARIEAARAVAKRAGAERLPSIDASGNVGVSRSNPNQSGNLPAGVNVDATRFSIGGDISASWDPDLFGRLRASERAAKLRLDAAGFDAEAVRIAIINDIAAAVVDWQNVGAQKVQLQANIASAEERARLIGSRVRAGLNPGLDKMRADAVVEGLRALMAPFDGQEAQIVARMVALTASPADTVRADLQRTGVQWLGGDAVHCSAPFPTIHAVFSVRPAGFFLRRDI
jgi:outer membrane protein, multidrug efflux system